jgi:glycosyltransferase involved in cell wall biosynthesis
MKVLISRGCWYGFGGAEISAADQAVVLRQMGYQVVFLTNSKLLRQQLKSQGVRVRRSLWAQKFTGIARHLHFALVWPLMWIQYAWITLREQPDVINPHSREDQIVFTLLRGLHRRPVVWKDPSDLRYQLKPERTGGSGHWYEKLLRRAIAQADHIYVLNEDDRELLIAEMADPAASASKVSAIPSSILYAKYDRAASPLAKRAPVIGTIIRLEESKGVQYLIEAVKRLPESLAWELWIVGEGSYRKALEKQAGGDSRIVFLGHRSEVSPYYRTFDVFVQPATNEGWGRTVKEASYFGVPIVGSRSGGIALQIKDGETGMLFTPGDSKEICSCLTQLLSNAELRTRLAANARVWAEQTGDFNNIVEDRIIPLYRRVIKHAHRV